MVTPSTPNADTVASVSPAFLSSAHFGANLAATRRAAGLTQTDLAQATGITQAQISKIERSGAQPTLETAARLAAALDANLTDMLRNSGSYRLKLNESRHLRDAQARDERAELTSRLWGRARTHLNASLPKSGAEQLVVSWLDGKYCDEPVAAAYPWAASRSASRTLKLILDLFATTIADLIAQTGGGPNDGCWSAASLQQQWEFWAPHLAALTPTELRQLTAQASASELNGNVEITMQATAGNYDWKVRCNATEIEAHRCHRHITFISSGGRFDAAPPQSASAAQLWRSDSPRWFRVFFNGEMRVLRSLLEAGALDWPPEEHERVIDTLDVAAAVLHLTTEPEMMLARLDDLMAAHLSEGAAATGDELLDELLDCMGVSSLTDADVEQLHLGCEYMTDLHVEQAELIAEAEAWAELHS